MNGQSILDKIIDTYRPNFDVEEPYEYHGEVYDAYAGFSMTLKHIGSETKTVA